MTHCERLLAFLRNRFPIVVIVVFTLFVDLKALRSFALIVFVNLVPPFCKYSLYLRLSFLVQLLITLQLFKVFINAVAVIGIRTVVFFLPMHFFPVHRALPDARVKLLVESRGAGYLQHFTQVNCIVIIWIPLVVSVPWP